MAAAPACVHSSMKILPLVLVAVAAVLSVPGKATSAQGDPLRGSAFRDYRGDNVENEDNVPASQLHSIRREVDGLAPFPRKTRSGLDSLSGVTFGWNKRLDSLRGITFGNQKRNFDEIDRSGFNSFVKKNFDEIDRSGFDGFVKKNFDEIDRVGFGSFVKRNAPFLLARSYEKENH
ncbi:orcokinin peptides type A-like isoform X3 [Zootermopsis nevadensis]|uniref:orcokinin peptides type A-like isoform X3 n=1 Tax=Zootermopsis nevadensis TaxID=136037 RepID=UPI000B8EDD6B|nr:orcokinin peptides type A-like isoform X3 [Zootermopsis nevadensis]